MRLERAARGLGTSLGDRGKRPREAPSCAPSTPRQGLVFVTAEERSSLCRERAEARHVIATASAPLSRGDLRQALDAAVEMAFASRGALPSAVDVDASARRTVGDQVFRLKVLGARGLVLALPRLRDAADRDGLLGARDSEALTAWLEASRTAPVLLVAGEEDRVTRLLTPCTLEDAAAEIAPESGEIATTHAAPAEPAPIADETNYHEDLLALLEADTTVARETTITCETTITRAHTLVSQADDPGDVTVHEAPASPGLEPPARAPVIKVAERLAKALEPAIEAPRQTQAARVVNAAEWRSFALDLDAARGPKPASVIDRLFTTRYMPLLGAAARGEVDGAVIDVIQTFRSGFEHSYRDGFAALRVTGKRPPMVLDAPDIAARLGRLNGARAVKLVLVDSMRFDLGELMTAKLTAATTGKAVCVERSLLWSALPTTTPTQLALIARGPDGLREAEPKSEGEPDITRGRAVSTMRRERVGNREIMKVDLVEARLRAGGPPHDERFDAIAAEVSELVARYIETLGPRTLLYVFGDHGFRLPHAPDGRGTAASTQGGATPEEVLVPAYAWLTGGMH